MASCRACGAGVGRQFRFCSQCGAAVGAELDLLDLAPPAHQEATVQFGRPARFWAAVAAGMAAVALGLWALSSIGGGSGADGNGADGEAARRNHPTTTLRSLASTSSETGGPATAGPQPTEPTTGGSGAGPDTSVVAGGGPMLGQPVGLSLLIGSGERLRRVDLDSGVVTTYRLPALPLLVTGSQVVLQNPSGALRSVPVDDIEAADAASGVAWTRYQPATVVAGPEPGQAWLADNQGDGVSWELVELPSGDVVRRLDTGPMVWWLGASALDPMVLGSSAGGVFERRGAGFERVADGELLAVGPVTVLTRTCADPVRCQLHWLDRATWAELDRPLPGDDAREIMAAEVSDDGRLLLYSSVNGPPVLFDVARGREVAAVGSYPDSLAVSPDGRWAAVVQVAGRLTLYDAERGELTDIPVSTSDGGRVVFLPNGPPAG